MNPLNNDNQDESTSSTRPEDLRELAEPSEPGFAAQESYTRRSPALLDLQEQVVAHVTAENYQPVKPRVIAKQLNLNSEQTKALKRAVRYLAKDGRLRYGENHLVLPPPAAQGVQAPEVTQASWEAAKKAKPEKFANQLSIVVGLFRRVASGAGFVRPSGTHKNKGRENDIAIPRAKTGDASDGDKVAVRLARGGKQDARGRITGEVVEILERDTHRFVGVYEERRGLGYVAVDGRVFADPVYVGDASAKAASPGDKVVIEIVRFPTHAHTGEGVIVEVLGAKGQPGVDTLSIIREFELPVEFPEAVLADARLQAEKFDESTGDRVDLTGETIITIDPVDARDFDDAISLQRLANGHWLLGAHIADVSHFVPLRSKLDAEARDRATSVYLPDRVIPMLPEIISNHLASLQPDKVRYTQSCFIEFNAEGVPVHAEVQRAAIRSQRRFSYEEVDDYLADRNAWREKLEPPVWELLGRMHELAMMLRKRRLDRGAIELTLPEVKIDLDEQGRVAGAHLVKNTESHQIIEEFMLAANEAVARLLSAHGLNFLRRIHEQPDLRKLQTLTGFVRELGIETESLESRFEIKRVIAAVGGSPREHAVNYAVLRSMQKAVYSPVEEGHYALNSENYCHFTSPIRRYPDLTVHRMLNDLASGRKPVDDFGSQMVLAEHCSEREQRAAKAERELVKVKLLSYLADHIGTKMTGVITGVEDFGFFVQGTDLPAEGLVHVQSLADDYYHFDRDTHSLAGRRPGHEYRLGDMVQVEIMRVDSDRRELDLRLVKKIGGGEPLHVPRTSQGDKRRDKRLSARGERFKTDTEAGRSGTKKPGRGASRSSESAASPARGKKQPSAKYGSPAVEKEAKKLPPKRKQRPGKRERAERKKQQDS
jgi:ribonuclease R